MPDTIDRYEVNEPDFIPTPEGHTTVWDWLKMEVLRDMAGEIMLYPIDTAHNAVAEMNKWFREHGA